MQSKSKKHMKKATPILGIAGLALSALSGHAQQFQYSSGDLILDFSESGYSDLEVNIGTLSTLTADAVANGGTIIVAGGGLNEYNVSSQLLPTFNNSTSGLTFSVVGTSGAGQDYLTESRANPAVANTRPNDVSTVPTSEASTAITQTIVGSENATGILPWSAGNPAGTGNTANVAIITTSSLDAASVNSFTHNIGNVTGYIAPVTLGNTTPGSFSGSIVSDLFGYVPKSSQTKATYDGYFTFNSNGSLDFTETTEPVAAPESGYFGVVAGSGLLLLTLGRQLRRQQA
jgi:hypothetical protein